MYLHEINTLHYQSTSPFPLQLSDNPGRSLSWTGVSFSSDHFKVKLSLNLSDGHYLPQPRGRIWVVPLNDKELGHLQNSKPGF